MPVPPTFGSEEIAAALRRCVETRLGERERRIIRLRYGLGGEPPLTQRETAQRLTRQGSRP